jgi:outer membrane protein assembly factor BamE (lipoprotein component of BamABCDE complex)
MNYRNWLIGSLIVLLQSCIVQSPTYTSLEQVMSLKTGMSKEKVEEVLGLKPYDLKANTDSTTIFIYVYRVVDRRTISIFTKPMNGRKSVGKYVQLEVTYSKDNKVMGIESCNLCPDNLVTNSKIDFQRIFALVTITLPIILVFIGLK